MNIFLKLITIIIISTECTCLRSSGFRSSSRSSSRSGSRPGNFRGPSRSIIRVNIGSRFTSRVGSSSNTFFRFTRTSTSSFGNYQYGSYSGARFGKTIRRSVFWPVRRVVYGTVYYRSHNNKIPPYSNMDISNNIVISDIYTKIKINETGFSYDCVAPGRSSISCFEPTQSQEIVDMETNPNIEIFDGGCCENLMTGQAFCCVIGINDNASNAKILKHIYFSLICLIITSCFLLIRRFC